MRTVPVGEASERRWFLAQHPQGQKRIHRAECRHARQEYVALRGLSVDEIVARLDRETEFGLPLSWHAGCAICSPDLDLAILDALGGRPCLIQ